MRPEHTPMNELSHRIAGPDDVAAIIDLMRAAIQVNMRAFLSPAEIEAAQETMGVDGTLIADGTYFLIETVHEGATVLVGCGGWGKRRPLYGGDHTAGRDDPSTSPRSTLTLDTRRIDRSRRTSCAPRAAS